LKNLFQQQITSRFESFDCLNIARFKLIKYNRSNYFDVIFCFCEGKLGLKVTSGEDIDTAKMIKLSLVPPNSDQRHSLTAHDSYQIHVTGGKENTITITGEWPSGVFYGVQTLLALMDDQRMVPQVSIKDSPRFSYRGLMLDVGRNFIPKHEILKVLDAMAMYKMNKFHFHLSENEGWRLEIPGLEELTQVRINTPVN